MGLPILCECYTILVVTSIFAVQSSTKLSAVLPISMYPLIDELAQVTRCSCTWKKHHLHLKIWHLGYSIWWQPKLPSGESGDGRRKVRVEECEFICIISWLRTAKQQNNANAMMTNALGLGDIVLCGANNQNHISWLDEELHGILLRLKGKKMILST